MDDLIEALTIFKKYQNEYGQRCPTHCEHDVLTIIGISEEQAIPKEERARLRELGFLWSSESEWISFRFGKA